MPRKRCEKIRKRAADRGVPVYAVSGNNDFSSAVPEHREAQLVYMRELTRMTADLGAKTLRVFLGWPGVTLVPLPKGSGRHDIARQAWETEHKPFAAAQIWQWCREGLIESARPAGDYGVTLPLQNHAPIIGDYTDVLRMVKEVDSPNLKVCLDAPLLKQQDAASVRKAALDTGALQKLSHFGGEDEEAPAETVKGPAFYKPFVATMAESGYSGYIGYELCHPLLVKAGQTVGIDFVDRSAQAVAKFMRQMIGEVYKG
jgi:sugar phosphate isomerase/epimerase